MHKSVLVRYRGEVLQDSAVWGFQERSKFNAGLDPNVLFASIVFLSKVLLDKNLFDLPDHRRFLIFRC